MVSPTRAILSEIQRIEGVRGVLLVTKDGFVLDSVVPVGDINQEGVAASIYTVMDSSTKFGAEFGLGEPNIVTVEYANGIVVVEPIKNVYLVVIAEKGAVLGRIRYEVQKHKERLAQVL